MTYFQYYLLLILCQEVAKRICLVICEVFLEIFMMTEDVSTLGIF